ncbi:MAG: peptidase U32 family protein [Bacteroidales bacterium]
MAPVGSYESLMAAVQAGADSVYFGLNKLNMRARSSVNFDVEDLEQIVNICKDHYIKTYLTLNIVMYDSEMQQMKMIIDAAKQKGVNAVIASDHAVINYARSVGMEVHISTQMNISNIESLKFYANCADVIVLARELNLDQVKVIAGEIEKQNIRGPNGELVKLEMFSHGALCMSVSGKCYLSLHHHNFSANRGACLQDCRREYTVKEKETDLELDIDNEYIMSPKDLSTIHFLNKMIDAGVRVFKIEGRARPPEYVKTVVSCYNEALNAIFEGTYNKNKIKLWRRRLSTVFNRGFWDGYYLGQKLGEWSHVYGSQATKKKVYVARAMNYFSNIRVAEFLCEAGNINLGDDVIITGPTTGVIETKIKEIRVELKNVDKALKGQRFSIPLDETVRRSDKLFIWADSGK